MSGSGLNFVDHDNNGTFSDGRSDIDIHSASSTGVEMNKRNNEDEATGLRIVTSLDEMADVEARSGSPDSQGTRRKPFPGTKKKEQRQKVVAWMDLPKKKQLAVVTIARLSEPLVQTSLQVGIQEPSLPTCWYSPLTVPQSYLFYQLKWFDPSLPDSTISSQAGILSASFTATQFLTAMVWGRVADSPRVGRKSVILIGLSGTSEYIAKHSE